MGERNSPFFAAGLRDGAADAARNPRERRGYDPDRKSSWMYKRGFARSFLTIRGLARDGLLDSRPGTIEAMQRGMNEAWAVLDGLQRENAT